MVTAEKRTARPVVGWVQVLAARDRMAALRSPRGGGELSSVPMTEKRKRAHRAAVEAGGVGVMGAPREAGGTVKRAVASVLRPAGRGSEGASPADRGRSSGERDPRVSGDRDRGEETEQPHPAVGVIGPAEESVEEGPRKGREIDIGGQSGAGHLPEGGVGEELAPEDLPARDGATIGAEVSGKLAEPARCRPVAHGGDQEDHDGEVDPSAEEAHRRRSDPLAAAVALAAEAESVLVSLGEGVGPAARLAGVVGTVQPTAAGTGPFARGLGKVFVDRDEERPESGVGGQAVIHRRVLRVWVTPYGVHPSGSLIQ